MTQQPEDRKRDVMAERAEAVSNERERCIRAVWECIGLSDDEKNVAINANAS